MAIGIITQELCLQKQSQSEGSTGVEMSRQP